MLRLRFAPIAIVGLLWATSARADLFSPGPLAKPHANLEGMSNCDKCHSSAGSDENFEQKCLACHTELAPSIKKGVGYHGHIPEEKRDCKNCHHDHQGVDFKMIEWPSGNKSNFPHNETGWPLKGAHAKVKCADCHEPFRDYDPVIRKWLDAHPKTDTFLGTPTTCETCHFDEHRGQLSTDCKQCHVEKSFKPAPGFNHDKTDYPLTGLHKTVACEKCHAPLQDKKTPGSAFPAPVKREFSQFTNISFESCQDCHQDPHKGGFGDRCSSCHSTAGWKIIHSAESERAFHDKTRFPLRGLHAEVACKSCHGPFPGHAAKFKGLSFDRCTSCHADAHEGQLTGVFASNCEACHDVKGFLPAKFELADHQKTRYPLEGAHAATPCAGCHVQTASLETRVPVSVTKLLKAEKRPLLFSLALMQFIKPLNQCETCHQDAHAGQFRSSGDSKACATCHQVSAFKDLKFNHDKDSRFPLTGKHATAQCEQCHQAKKFGKVTTVAYRPLNQSCASCHADAHAGQFHKKDAPDEIEDCARCHNTESFKPVATTFVHAPPFTDYVLDGQHQNVACNACHQSVVVTAGVEVRKYTGLPTNCAGCHQDFHHGEFRQFTQ
ncbi:MAG: hypothetical protein JST54_01510 [Deltaproteobacteria bacterium]|nr:hypothetical protein [Deltaproteobacteria bacterium]